MAEKLLNQIFKKWREGYAAESRPLTKQEFEKNLIEIWNALLSVQINHSAWLSVRSRAKKAKWGPFQEGFPDFYHAVVIAHLSAVVMGFGIVFNRDKRSVGFWNTIREGENLGFLDSTTVAAARAKLKSVSPSVIRILNLRNKVVAHREGRNSPDKVIHEVIPEKDFAGLLKISKETLNILSRGFDGTDYPFDVGDPSRDIEELLALIAGDGGA